MSETPEAAQIHRGLKGVYFDRSRVCFIDGRAGELRYRGYSIHDLAEHSTFEETCYLLLHGELPTRDGARALRRRAEGRAHAARARSTTSFARCKSAHPMDVLRTAVSALAAFDPDVGRQLARRRRCARASGSPRRCR